MKIKSLAIPAKTPTNGPKSPKTKSSTWLLVVLLSACTITSLITYAVAIKLQEKGNSWSPFTSPLSGWAHRKGYWTTTTSVGPIKALLLAPTNILPFAGLHNIPEIIIDIKFKHLQKIYKIRNAAMEKGLLVKGEDDYVPASIRHGNRTINVKLRLKGDATDHLQEDKWSYRVHVKGKDHVFGLRRFSIQAPWVRAFHGEILFGETLRHVGVLAPRYFFVNVIINGNDIGVMAIEEHFSKELLENSGRPEGVIVKFSDAAMWSQLSLENERKEALHGLPYYNYSKAPIDAFRSSRIAKSKKLSQDLAIATGLLRAFQKKELSASEVFDIEKMGSFLAVAELWGAMHSTAWANLVLYLNPITMKIEPIGYDASISLAVVSPDGRRGRLSAGEIIIGGYDSNRAILSSPEIFSAYVKALRGLARDVLEGGLITKLKDVEKKYLPVLKKEAFLLSEFPWESMIKRAGNLLKASDNEEELLKIINNPRDSSKSFPAILQAYNIQNQDASLLELENLIGHEVEVQSVKWIPMNDGNSLPFEPIPNVKFPISIPPSPYKGALTTLRLFYKPLKNQNSFSLQVTANVQGEKRLYKSLAEKYHPILKKNPFPAPHLKEQLTKYPFLALNQKERALHIKKGQWTIKDLLVLPVDFSLTISPGTTLEFESAGGIIAHGPLVFEGTENAPILLKGLGEKGGDALWQGVSVFASKKTSEWSYVTVLNTAGIKHKGWEPTGGVTFYRSHANMKHCIFQGNRAEDALNIIHSKFHLANIEFRDTLSDGFDVDYAEGKIENSTFKNIGIKGGGDGLDLSFSNVTANSVSFHNIIDKALSVGEKSRMRATNITIEHAGTGATSKDGSFLDISSSTIKLSKVAGMMAYIKKPEFGSASIEASNITFAGSAPATRLQKGNSIIIDGKVLKGEEIDVKQLYETFMKHSSP